jgi:uncharacterized protein (TIGR00290 family)
MLLNTLLPNIDNGITVPKPKAVMSWSSGKDSAFALHQAKSAGDLDIVAILTSLNSDAERVSMHGVREQLLDAQSDVLGLPIIKVNLPERCSNEIYEREMAKACVQMLADGVSHLIFGDLFLQDIRDYRIKMLDGTGLSPVFPIWGMDTATLAQDMIASGVKAQLTCIDTKVLNDGFSGRLFDQALLDELPAKVDPCGENGEFHTFCFAGPMYDKEISVESGLRHRAGDFLFTDLRRA